MAKDNRKIHSGVRLGGTTYTDGMEDELAGAASAKQLKRLVEKGAISGEWSSSAAPLEDEVDDTEDAQDDEVVDDEETDDSEVDLQSMTIAQLKAHAEELGIELTATKKADIIGEIEAAG